MKKYCNGVAVIIIIACFLTPMLTNPDRAQGFTPWPIDELIGKTAPDFSLEDLSGKTEKLSSHKGKPVLLNFWATWCPYCRKERSDLNRLYQMYRDKELVIMSVSIDKSLSAVQNFIKKQPSDFAILWDKNGSVASSYSVSGLPTSILIDKKGIVKHKLIGFRPWTSSESKKLIDAVVID